jgi:hypothetical protein
LGPLARSSFRGKVLPRHPMKERGYCGCYTGPDIAPRRRMVDAEKSPCVQISFDHFEKSAGCQVRPTDIECALPCGPTQVICQLVGGSFRASGEDAGAELGKTAAAGAGCRLALLRPGDARLLF